jgi:hypothetical protein
MNIVSLEGRMQELLDLKETITNREAYFKYGQIPVKYS